MFAKAMFLGVHELLGDAALGCMNRKVDCVGFFFVRRIPYSIIIKFFNSILWKKTFEDKDESFKDDLSEMEPKVEKLIIQLLPFSDMCKPCKKLFKSEKRQLFEGLFFGNRAE